MNEDNTTAPSNDLGGHAGQAVQPQLPTDNDRVAIPNVQIMAKQGEGGHRGQQQRDHGA